MNETELDTRIRALVLDVIDRTPSAPEVVTATGPGHVPRPRAAMALVALAVTALLVTGAFLALDRRGPGTGTVSSNGHVVLALRSVPEGVTARSVRGTPVFFVRRGNAVLVLVNSAQHLHGERVWWCPALQHFRSPRHGESFAPDGTRLGGPARRGLDRMPAIVRGGRLIIDPDHVIRGEAAARADAADGVSPPSTFVPPSTLTDKQARCGDGLARPVGAPLTP